MGGKKGKWQGQDARGINETMNIDVHYNVKNYEQPIHGNG